MTAGISLICATAPSFAVYAVARAMLGALAGGAAVSYVLCTEWSTPTEVATVTTALNFSFAFANVLLVGIAAAGHKLSLSWREQELIIVGVLSIPSLLAAPWILESPRFFLSAGRRRRAELTILQALRRGGVRPEHGTTLAAGMQAAYSAENGGAGEALLPSAPPALRPRCACCGRLGQLFACPQLARVLIMSWCWLAASLLYYGLSFEIGSCSPPCDLYVNGMMLALSDLPGYTVALWLADSLGRRNTLSMLFILGGSCLALTPVAEDLAPDSVYVPLVLSLIGKACTAGVFQVAYIYPVELFPTPVRASALGVCNIFARIGTMLAPLAANVPPTTTQLVLGSCGLLAGLLTCLLPETRGRTL
jgi:hypothetical protein